MECFMIELPKRELLEQKLHKAVELARKRLAAKQTTATQNTNDVRGIKPDIDDINLEL